MTNNKREKTKNKKTNDKQQTRKNKKQKNKRQTTNDKQQPTTHNPQPTTNNKQQQTTNNKQQTTNSNTQNKRKPTKTNINQFYQQGFQIPSAPARMRFWCLCWSFTKSTNWWNLKGRQVITKKCVDSIRSSSRSKWIGSEVQCVKDREVMKCATDSKTILWWLRWTKI